jgi:hypothetical protein
MEKYLKPEQHYIDRYDRSTVNLMRMKEKLFLERDVKFKSNKKADKFMRATNGLTKDLALYFETGERYLNKSETIREWMEEDRQRDSLIESAEPPVGIFCLVCGKEMIVESKVLHSGSLNTKDKVLFIFRCESCRQGRGFFHTGEEFITKPEHCDKCGSVLDKTHKRTEEKIITYYRCSEHGLVKTDELDMGVQAEEADPNYETDRDRFCVSAKDGQEYLSFKIKSEQLKEVLKKIEDREVNKDLYDKVASIKKLSIVELENLLIPEMEKNGYIKLELMKPIMRREVTADFTVRDTQPGRDSYQSRSCFKKIVIDILKDTNWRLVISNIQVQLGILSGSIKGYEHEEDLIKLIKK